MYTDVCHTFLMSVVESSFENSFNYSMINCPVLNIGFKFVLAILTELSADNGVCIGAYYFSLETLSWPSV